MGWCYVSSFFLVAGILLLAFRSVRLVVAATLTLLTGLVWTAAVAALAVGQLNVVSVAFGVLFIGLGIDFAIHLGMHCVDAERAGVDADKALLTATERTGSSLVICALTTMVGFYAFIPTPYRGVAELGLISCTGMIIILAQTLTCLPALLAVLPGKDTRAELPRFFHLHLAPPHIVTRRPGLVVLLFAVLGGGTLTLLPQARFDMNVVNMRNPDAKSVQAFNDLLAQSDTSPWSIDTIAPNLKAAEGLSQRIREVDLVDKAITLSDYVPSHQEEKIEILTDASFMLEFPAAPDAGQEPLAVEEQIAALRDLHDELDTSRYHDAEAPLLKAAARLKRELATFLARIEGLENAADALAELEQSLLGNLPGQLERLRRALRPSEVTLAGLPRQLSRRLLTPEGIARIQIFPQRDLGETGTLPEFVDAVRAIEPDACGVAVNLVEFGRATVTALRQALGAALVASAVVILLLS